MITLIAPYSQDSPTAATGTLANVRTYLAIADELHKLMQLLDGSHIDWLDALVAFLGPPAELGHQPLGYLRADEHHATLQHS